MDCSPTALTFLCSHGGATAARKGVELRKGACAAGNIDQAIQGGREVREKMGFAPFEAEKTERPEDLHQALGRGEEKEFAEFLPT